MPVVRSDHAQRIDETLSGERLDILDRVAESVSYAERGETVSFAFALTNSEMAYIMTRAGALAKERERIRDNSD